MPGRLIGASATGACNCLSLKAIVSHFCGTGEQLEPVICYNLNWLFLLPLLDLAFGQALGEFPCCWISPSGRPSARCNSPGLWMGDISSTSSSPLAPAWRQVLRLAFPVWVQQLLIWTTLSYDQYLAGNNQPEDTIPKVVYQAALANANYLAWFL